MGIPAAWSDLFEDLLGSYLKWSEQASTHTLAEGSTCYVVLNTGMR
jgi:hypothetical protein